MAPVAAVQHGLVEEGFAQHLVALLQEHPQQTELGDGEVQGAVPVAGGLGVQIQGQAVQPEMALAGPLAGAALQRHPAQHGGHPHRQLGHAERLGQVVVGAAHQAGDAVLFVAQRGQQDHRHRAGFAQTGQQRQAVQPGQQDVQQHQIEIAVAGQGQALAAVAAQRDPVIAVAEVIPQVGAQYGIVLDHQQARRAGRYGIHSQIVNIIIPSIHNLTLFTPRSIVDGNHSQ